MSVHQLFIIIRWISFVLNVMIIYLNRTTIIYTFTKLFKVMFLLQKIKKLIRKRVYSYETRLLSSMTTEIIINASVT